MLVCLIRLSPTALLLFTTLPQTLFWVRAALCNFVQAQPAASTDFDAFGISVFRGVSAVGKVLGNAPGKGNPTNICRNTFRRPVSYLVLAGLRRWGHPAFREWTQHLSSQTACPGSRKQLQILHTLTSLKLYGQGSTRNGVSEPFHPYTSVCLEGLQAHVTCQHKKCCLKCLEVQKG